jgi:hypothetical protein
MTIPPTAGDIWRILSSGHRVPCNENIYSFTTTGIEENSRSACITPFSVVPTVFKSGAWINFTVNMKSNIKISLYNVLGQRVAVLLNRICQPGAYNIHWTGENLSSGIYFVRVDSEDTSEVKKVVYIK